MTIESTKMSSDSQSSESCLDHPSSGKMCPVLYAEDCYNRLEDSSQGRSSVSRTATRILSSSRSRKSWEGRTFRGAFKWFFNVVCLVAAWLYLLVPCTHAATSRTCMEVNEECGNHGLGCSQVHTSTLMNIHSSCRDLLEGRSDTCSPTCDQELQTLVNLEVKGWFTCNCTGYAFMTFDETLCRGIQENLRVCPSYPPPEPEPVSTTPSYAHVGSSPVQVPSGVTPTSPPKAMCAEARDRCEVSDSCQVALRNVLDICDPPSCNSACINAIDKLEAIQESAALWRCDCTGEVGEEVLDNEVEEAPWCSRLQDDFLQACQTKENEIRYGMLSSTPAGNFAENEARDSGGSGFASPRLYRPPMFMAVCVASIVAILNFSH